MKHFGIPGLCASGGTKKLSQLVGVLALCLLLLAGCAAQDSDDGAADNPTAPPSSSDVLLVDEVVTEENIFEFVTLGQYKGLGYDPISVAVVTDEEIEEWISYHMSYAIGVDEITDRPVMMGDIAVIDYEGMLNGVPFAGGTDFGFELTIGSGMFIPGFEEQIIGHYAGEQFEINVTFPASYHAPDLAGQPVVFRINLVKVLAEIMPELTDEFVREYLNLASVAEYRAMIREQLEIDNELEAENNVKNQVWNQIVENATVHKLPKEEVEFRVSRGMMQFIYYSEMYNIELEDLIGQIAGMTLEDFINEDIRPNAMNDVKMDLVLRAIAAQEGITVTEAEFVAAVREFVEDYGYESEEHFLTLNGVEPVRIALLSENVIEVIMANSIAR